MRLSVKLCLILVIFIFPRVQAQQISHYLTIDNAVREYDIHLPQNFENGMPLVIALHGWGSNGDVLRNYTLLHEFADTSGFVLAIPLGSEDGGGWPSWNVGLKHCPIRGQMPTVNDVGFINAMIDSIHDAYAIDLTRVYTCGFSTGGELSLRLGAQLGHRLAAIASVAGTMYDTATTWKQVRPIPLIEFHGTRDQFNFYYSSDSSIFDHSPEEWAIPRMLNYWVENNGCDPTADTVDLPNTIIGDNCRIQRITWAGNSEYSKVIHYKIINGGHHWPQAQFNFTNGGYINRDINGNQSHWSFFENYTNPYSGSAYIQKMDFSYISGLPYGYLSILRASLKNEYEHPVSVNCIVHGLNSGLVDTVKFTDNGLDWDSTAGDNIFSGMFTLNRPLEEHFEAHFQVTDRVDSITIPHYEVMKFTGTGPLKSEGIAEITAPIEDPGSHGIMITISNRGSSVPVEDVLVRIESDHPSITGFTKNQVYYGDINPGESKVPDNPIYIANYCWFQTQDTLAGEFSIPLSLEIISQGEYTWHDTVVLRGPVGISNGTNEPTTFTLQQNYPNPFNPSTTISYDLPEQSEVNLTIYDLKGQQVATLQNQEQSAGHYEVHWKGLDASGNLVSSGVYFCRLSVGDYIKTIKMDLLR